MMTFMNFGCAPSNPGILVPPEEELPEEERDALGNRLSIAAF